MEGYKKNEFNKKLSKKEFNIEEFGIDNFCVSSFNYTLSNLIYLEKNKSSDIIQKSYSNICCPLFIKDNKDNSFPQMVELLYNPHKFKGI